MRVVVLFAALGCAACSGEGEPPVPVEPTPESNCAPGERAVGDACIGAGTQDDGCPAGELSVGGACVPAGVPPELCAEGFEPDGLFGCAPILPAGPCSPGLVALPGERSCHEIMSCGTGNWGDIATELDTQFVDASYMGPSDGSSAQPWLTIADAVLNAADGAIVAIAQGTYPEDVVVQGKALRILGRCPSLVSVVGSGSTLAAVSVLSGADGTTIGGLRVSGASSGVLVSGSLDVVLEQLWVEQTVQRGLALESGLGPTFVLVRNSLVERAREFGVFSAGAEVIVEHSVVRETQQEGMQYGRGVSARNQPMTGERGALTVRASLIEANHRAGVFAFATDVTVEASVVRDTLGGLDSAAGAGIWSMLDEAGNRAAVTLDASYVATNSEVGILAYASDVTLRTTTVFNNLPSADHPQFGRGIEAQIDAPTGQRGVVTIVQSSIADNHGAGVNVAGADATLEGVLVRGTIDATSTAAGVAAQYDQSNGAPASIAVRGSRIEDNRGVGLLVNASDAHVIGTAIVDTAADANGIARAIHVNGLDPVGPRSHLEVSGSRLAGSPEHGLFALGSDVIVTGTAIDETPDSAMGWGVVVGWDSVRGVRGSSRIQSS
ncbi:MAG TPA: right-handed parallel beta-helix repeat-containing protein, partial [Polyangiaceae bacterium]|nr:right-handed parallel beta-helix repeat-containing protein [Polyangiaceae bacterium]